MTPMTSDINNNSAINSINYVVKMPLPTSSHIQSTWTRVYCTLQIPGIHRWLNCPYDEVKYLRDYHRHVFHIKATIQVCHDDRDVEFIMLKNKIDKYLREQYFDPTQQVCMFGDRSCEMIAQDLISTFSLIECEVSEDGENGSIVTVVQQSGI